MADSVVLTDGAKFKCAHMPAPLGISEGISISLTTSKIKVNGAKAILNGAVISGFTPVAGCSFADNTGPKPCQSFSLSQAPASGRLSEGQQKVYLEADKSAISLIPSSGNLMPGLTIVETQTKLKA